MNADALAIHDLQAVAAVAQHGHFGRAAAALRVAQPTLSGRIQKVELALGLALFERSPRRFLVTPDGAKVLPVVRDLLAAAERLRTEAAERTAHQHASPMRLGVIPTLGSYLMPHLLLPLRRAKPHLELTISEQTTASLLAGLLDGSLDAALLSLPMRSPALSFTPLFDEPFRLIAPVGNAILRAERLVPAAMRACNMVLLEDGHCLRNQALAACGKRGGTAPHMVTTSLETLKYVVAAGGGYSLLPALACDLPKGLASLVAIRAFDERTPARRIGLCMRHTLARRERALELAEFIRQSLPPGVTAVPRGPAGKAGPARQGAVLPAAQARGRKNPPDS